MIPCTCSRYCHLRISSCLFWQIILDFWMVLEPFFLLSLSLSFSLSLSLSFSLLLCCMSLLYLLSFTPDACVSFPCRPSAIIMKMRFQYCLQSPQPPRPLLHATLKISRENRIEPHRTALPLRFSPPLIWAAPLHLHFASFCYRLCSAVFKFWSCLNLFDK